MHNKFIIILNKNNYFILYNIYIYILLIRINLIFKFKKIKNFFFFFYLKLRLKGRFYYMQKTKRSITFILTQSHNFVIYLINIYTKIKRWKKLYLISFNRNNLYKFNYLLNNFHTNHMFLKKCIHFGWTIKKLKFTSRKKYF